MCPCDKPGMRWLHMRQSKYPQDTLGTVVARALLCTCLAGTESSVPLRCLQTPSLLGTARKLPPQTRAQTCLLSNCCMLSSTVLLRVCLEHTACTGSALPSWHTFLPHTLHKPQRRTQRSHSPQDRLRMRLCLGYQHMSLDDRTCMRGIRCHPGISRSCTQCTRWRPVWARQNQACSACKLRLAGLPTALA